MLETLQNLDSRGQQVSKLYLRNGDYQMNMSKLMDVIFICASIIFNISVSVFYIAAKLGNMVLVQVCGAIVLSLIIPFTITLLGYVKEKAEKGTIISHVFILFYLFLELFIGLYP